MSSDEHSTEWNGIRIRAVRTGIQSPDPDFLDLGPRHHHRVYLTYDGRRVSFEQWTSKDNPIDSDHRLQEVLSLFLADATVGLDFSSSRGVKIEFGYPDIETARRVFRRGRNRLEKALTLWGSKEKVEEICEAMKKER